LIASGELNSIVFAIMSYCEIIIFAPSSLLLLILFDGVDCEQFSVDVVVLIAVVAWFMLVLID